MKKYKFKCTLFIRLDQKNTFQIIITPEVTVQHGEGKKKKLHFFFFPSRGGLFIVKNFQFFTINKSC